MKTFDDWWAYAQPAAMVNQPLALRLALRELAEKGWNAAIGAAEAELEEAFSEADTLNLLHGAARVAAMRSNR